MYKYELSKILREHKQWLDDVPGGIRANLRDANFRDVNLLSADLQGAILWNADLRDADLQGAYLQGASLRNANLRNADLQDANLQGAILWNADLRNADLREANLLGADLQGANLHGANLVYSCWPLWCGSLDVKVDAEIARQLAYHFCRLDCDDSEYQEAREALKDFANKFHLVEECGKITGEKTK